MLLLPELSLYLMELTNVDADGADSVSGRAN